VASKQKRASKNKENAITSYIPKVQINGKSLRSMQVVATVKHEVPPLVKKQVVNLSDEDESLEAKMKVHHPMHEVAKNLNYERTIETDEASSCRMLNINEDTEDETDLSPTSFE
jgi:predicted PilT family ATPase